MNAAIELRQVSRTYGSGAGEVHALRELDLSVQPGELVAVMGPSGSGKSTLLTIAGSLEEPSSGEVLVMGLPLASMSGERPGTVASAHHRLRLPGLQPAAGPDRGRECRRFHSSSTASAYGLRGRSASQYWRSWGRRGQADHYPDDLSGGERQRIAIARAVVGDRGVLLADEPTGALDSVNGEAVMRMLRTACRRGVAGVVVTHDAQLASWADRIVFLRDGRIVDQTTRPAGPETLLGQSAVR